MNPDIEYNLAAHDARIRMHYDHAREKHPYFCDKAESPVCIDHLEYLNFLREYIGEQMKRNSLNWHTLLKYNLAKVSDALAHGDTARAVEECYDAIAVLLRTIDVLEGRQKLGRIKAEGATP